MSGTTTATHSTYSTKKTHSPVIFHTVIKLTIFTFILQITAVSALDISLNAPSPVEINEEFTTTIFLSETVQENYDVKIFVHNSEDAKITKTEYISEIYNDETQTWSDPWYYLLKTFPQQTKYKIRVLNSPGNRKLCAKLRKSAYPDSGVKEVCIPLEVTGTVKEEILEEETPEETTNTEIKEDSEKSSESKPANPLPQEKTSPPTEIVQNLSPEKIVLNSATPEMLQTKSGEKRNYLIYFFFIFLFFLIVLLALKRL